MASRMNKNAELTNEVGMHETVYAEAMPHVTFTPRVCDSGHQFYWGTQSLGTLSILVDYSYRLLGFSSNMVN